jgi:hypothetical protein
MKQDFDIVIEDKGFRGTCVNYRPIAFVLHINFIELSKINRILRHLTEANRIKFEVFVA